MLKSILITLFYLQTRSSTLYMLNSIFYAQKHTHHSFLQTRPSTLYILNSIFMLNSIILITLFYTLTQYSLYAKQHFYAKQHNTHHTFLFHSPSTLILNSIITLHMLTAFQHVYVIKTRISLITSL